MADTRLTGGGFNLDMTAATRNSSGVWTSLKLAPDIESTLNKVKKFSSNVNNVVGTIYNLVITSMKILKVLVGLVIDPEVKLLKAAIEAARALIKDLVNDSGLYVLVVPPANLLVPFSEIVNVQLDDSNYSESTKALLRGDSVGGNVAFLRAVQNSLVDPNDPFKPEFGSDDYVAGMVLLIGADTYLEILSGLKALANLLSSGVEKSPLAEGFRIPATPKPENFRATVIGAATLIEAAMSKDAAENPYAVRLDWDFVDPTFVLEGTSIVGTITDVRIYRSETPLSDFAPDIEKYEIDSFGFSEFSFCYLDRDLEPGKTYYYGAAFEYEYGEESATSVVGLMSTAVVTAPTETPWNHRGVPPDWYAVNGLFSLIPQLHEVVIKTDSWLASLEKKLVDKTDEIQERIDKMELTVQQYSKFVKDISTAIDRVIQAFTIPSIYTGFHTFSGKGGNGFMVNNLAESILNTTDPSAPPFNKGTEAVAGIILMAGATSPAKMERLVETIKLIFGESSSSNVLTATSEAYADGAAAIDVILDDLDRQITIEDNFIGTVAKVEPPTTTTTTTTTTPTPFGPHMEKADEDATATKNKYPNTRNTYIP